MPADHMIRLDSQQQYILPVQDFPHLVYAVVSCDAELSCLLDVPTSKYPIEVHADT